MYQYEKVEKMGVVLLAVPSPSHAYTVQGNALTSVKVTEK